MATTATRSVSVTFAGDFDGTESYSAASNTTSVGAITFQSLASGFNSVSVPASTGFTCTAVTIVPPTGNSTSITLKGVTGDTGIRLHNTDPTSLSINSDVTAIGLTAGAAIQGVRFVWS